MSSATSPTPGASVVPAHRTPEWLPRPWVLAVALVAAAANLRLALAGVPPLAQLIVTDLHLSNAEAGALTTLPVLCMGLFAPAAHWLSTRYGAAPTVFVALACLTLGSLTRLGGAHLVALYGGTLLAGVGIAVAGTLLPRLVKTLFPPERVGLVTGVYMVSMMVGAAGSSAAAVPLAELLGSWQASLASWTLLGLLGLLAWSPLARTVWTNRAEVTAGASSTRLPLRHPTAWIVAGYLLTQSWAFYSCLAWISPSYVQLGWDRTHAGYLLAVFSATQIVSGLLAPVLTDRVHDLRTLLLAAAVFGTAGLLGLLLAPTAAPWVWVGVIGIGQGAAFALALVVLVRYAATPAASGRLSAMGFLVGYGIASFGPVTMGAIRDATHGFHGVWLILVLLMGAQVTFVVLLHPARPKVP
jgi:CP family cyanate transporter-like MFS transporter